MREYATPAAFRAAVEARLDNARPPGSVPPRPAALRKPRSMVFRLLLAGPRGPPPGTGIRSGRNRFPLVRGLRRLPRASRSRREPPGACARTPRRRATSGRQAPPPSAPRPPKLRTLDPECCLETIRNSGFSVDATPISIRQPLLAVPHTIPPSSLSPSEHPSGAPNVADVLTQWLEPVPAHHPVCLRTVIFFLSFPRDV